MPDDAHAWDHMARAALGVELRAAATIHAGDPAHVPAPHIQWVISKGIHGTPGHLPPEACEMAEEYWLHLIDAVTDRYLLETELTARQAMTAATAAEGKELVQWDRLSPEQRREWNTAADTLDALSWLMQQWPEWPAWMRVLKGATAAGVQAVLQVHPTQQVILPSDAEAGKLDALKQLVTPEDMAVAEAIMARTETRTADGRRSYQPPPPDETLWTQFPSGRPALDTYLRLQAVATLSPEEAAAECTKILTRPDGIRRPTFREWLDARGHARLTLRAHHALSLRARDEEIATERRAREEAERALEAEKRRAEEAEQRAAEAEERAQRRTPTLRAGTGLLRAMAMGEDRIKDVARKGQVAGRLTAEQVEARKLFEYNPLGWAERLTVHALATIARERGLLDAHPWALTSRPMAGDPAPRVKLEYPGISELARVAGFTPGPNGKIAGAHRTTMERALRNLVAVPRWIAQPVLVAVKQGKRTKLVEDIEVTQTLWVEARGTVLTRRAELLLHPVAFASHLVSFVTVDNLAARYEEARRAIDGKQMRDEWAVCDDYLRYLASVKAFERRNTRKRAGNGAEQHATTAGEATVTADVADTTLRERLGITHLTRDRGEAKVKQRVDDALAFAVAMGTLRSYTLESGEEGLVWRLRLAHPDINADRDQWLLPLECEASS